MGIIIIDEGCDVYSSAWEGFPQYSTPASKNECGLMALSHNTQLCERDRIVMRNPRL